MLITRYLLRFTCIHEGLQVAFCLSKSLPFLSNSYKIGKEWKAYSTKTTTHQEDIYRVKFMSDLEFTPSISACSQSYLCESYFADGAERETFS